jgi:hypothetical protein
LKEPATKADLEQLPGIAKLHASIDRLEAGIDRLDKRLVVMQWIGFIFLAINGSLTAMLLWTMAMLLAR